MPPETVVRLMEGYRTKNSVLAALEENSRTAQLIAQLQAENEALRREVMPLDEAMAAL